MLSVNIVFLVRLSYALLTHASIPYNSIGRKVLPVVIFPNKLKLDYVTPQSHSSTRFFSCINIFNTVLYSNIFMHNLNHDAIYKFPIFLSTMLYSTPWD